jgi:hypothetical protein
MAGLDPAIHDYFFDCSEKDGFQPDWAAEGK